jgi:arsenate reductase
VETTLYGITNCDTVKRARTWLKTMGIDYQLHDYKKLGCSTDQARQFLDHFGTDAVLNRRGTTWRKLSDGQKSDLSEDSVILLMSEHPSLIKRPILQRKSDWLIGFDESAWQNFFNS